MELQKLLMKAIQKRFILNAKIKAFEEKVEQIAKRNTFKKLENDIIYRYGLKYEFGGVVAICSTWQNDLTFDYVELRLVFFCVSKLPKRKRERLKEVRSIYQKEKNLLFNNYKIPIYLRFTYSVDIEDALSGNFNLNLRE